MQTVVTQLESAFRRAIHAAVGFEADPLLSVSQNEKFGDYQANAAMGLAKRLAETSGEKTNPRAVAERIKSKLELGEFASEISIAGPGFINVRLNPAWVAAQLQSAAADARVGVAAVDHPQRIVVDYSGPNIAKEMHVGHLRSTIIGDAISRALEFQGHRVIRQNHIGDWGTQFGKVVLAMWYMAMAQQLGRSESLLELTTAMTDALKIKDVLKQAEIVHRSAVLDQDFVDVDPDGTDLFLPYLQSSSPDLPSLERIYQFVGVVTESPTAAQEPIEHPRHGRKVLAEIPRLTTTFIQHPEDDRNKPEQYAWEKAREVTLETCNAIYQKLGVKLRPEDVRGESQYNPELPRVVSDLEQAGIAENSHGAVVVQVSGFESPLIIRKSDGGYLYGTTDLAAIRYRINTLHANRIIYTHDSRQAQHFAQVFATAKRASWAKDVELDYAPFGTMLGEDGKPFKTRSGDTVKLKDLLEEAEERGYDLAKAKEAERVAKAKERGEDVEPLTEEQLRHIGRAVGIGAVKYSDLSKDRISDYVFSWDKMLAMDGNTAPYLQYAYARIRSIFRKAGVAADLSAGVTLATPFELSLAKHILRLGEIVELVARELKPHHLCTYLYDLAQKFSGFYEHCPVVASEGATRTSRLALCEVTGRTIARGLDLLGIEHPDQM
jgi:arginyl-tRNA synthetase